VPLFREWQQVFREEGQLVGVNAEFAGTGAELISSDADVIAKVEQLPEFKAGIADGIFLDVELETLSFLLQVCESGFAHQTDGHDASGNAHIDAGRLQIFARLAAVGSQNLRDGVAEVVFVRIGGLPESLNLLQLFTPDFVNIFVE